MTSHLAGVVPYDLEGPMWDDFAATCFGKRPHLFKRPFGDQPIVTPAQAFDAAVRACDDFQCRRDDPGPPRVSLAGGLDAELEYLERRVPVRADVDLAGFERRLRAELGSSPFLCTVNEHQVFDVAFWKRLRRFLGGLYRRVGVSSGYFAATLWIGMYERTPFGIHTDHADAFSYLVAGRKKMLLWPWQAFEGHRRFHTSTGVQLGTTAYERYMSSATVLEMEPGDLAYWPATYWHLAASDANLSVSANWACVNQELPRVEPLKLVLRELQDLARSAHPDDFVAKAYSFDTDRLQVSANELPAPIRRARDAVQKLCTGPLLADAMTVAWVRTLSSRGLREAPEADANAILREDDMISADPMDPILIVPLGPSRLLVGANGYTLELPYHPALPGLFERLNSGAACWVRELEDPFTHQPPEGWSRIRARLVLEWLLGIHALAKSEPHSASRMRDTQLLDTSCSTPSCSTPSCSTPTVTTPRLPSQDWRLMHDMSKQQD